MVGLTREQRAERERQKQAAVQAPFVDYAPPAVDSLDDDARVRIADEVVRIMRTDAMKVAFAKAESTFIGQWRNGQTVDIREQAHAKLSALEEVRRQLQIIQDDATIIKSKRRANGVN